MQEGKTFEEHLRYLRQIVKLKLWFAGNWLSNHPEEDLSFVLRWRVDIYRKTVFWRSSGFPTSADFKVPAWLALEQQVQAFYEEMRHDLDPAGFERKAFAVVWGAVEANALYDLKVSLADKGFQCGSLGYTPPSTTNPGLVSFHITNALQPCSIFSDRAYLPRCLLCVMDKAEAEYGASSLATGSWLNSYPRWLELFPQEYLDNMEPEEEQIWCGLGYWGQFLTARGTFDTQRGRLLRETGRLPYPRKYSRCSFEAMRLHLNAYLNGAPEQEMRLK
jgi:hypothetical protein